AGLNLVGIGGEGDVARHVEDDLVADAGDTDPGAAQLLAQPCLLTVHVLADPSACQAAYSGADQGPFPALLGIVAAEYADGRAGNRANASADGGLAGLLFAGVRVGGLAAAQSEAQGEQSGHGDFHGCPHSNFFLSLESVEPCKSESMWRTVERGNHTLRKMRLNVGLTGAGVRRTPTLTRQGRCQQYTETGRRR